MTGQRSSHEQRDEQRVPNGHGYCWAKHSTGVRCCQPKGHSGMHLYPYTPRTEW